MFEMLKSLLLGKEWPIKVAGAVSRQTINMKCELVARTDPAHLEICHPYMTRRRAWPMREKLCIFHKTNDGLEYYEKP